MEITVKKVSNGYIVEIISDTERYLDGRDVTKIAREFNEVVAMMVEAFELNKSD